MLSGALLFELEGDLGMKTQEMKLEDLADKNWFTDLDDSSFWLRIYTLMPVSHANLQKCFNDAILNTQLNNQPIKIVYIAINDGLKLPCIKSSFPYSNPDNRNMQINVELSEFSLPKSSYIFMLSPFRRDGVEGEELDTKNTLNQAEAIFSSYIGNNLLHTIVFDGERAITQNGKVGIPSRIVATLQKCDGPLLLKENWQGAYETFKAIEALSEKDKKHKINLSLRFFQKGKTAFDSDESFFLYWTAIIALGTSKTEKINEKLQTLYSLSKAEVEEQLKWEWAYRARNDILHNASSINFHMHIERYFQVLFLDLLRLELGLSHNGYLKSYIDSEQKLDIPNVEVQAMHTG